MCVCLCVSFFQLCMTGWREGGEEGGVEGWTWINVVAADDSFPVSSGDDRNLHHSIFVSTAGGQKEERKKGWRAFDSSLILR